MSDPHLPLPPTPPSDRGADAWSSQLVAAVAGAWGTGRRRLLASLALVGGLVVVVSVVIVAVQAASDGVPKPPPELVLPRADDGDAAAGSPSRQRRALVVHAAGAVVHPGLQRLPPGSRVADLVAAAGGPSPDADLDQLNLAAPLSDGERVYVPRRGEAGSVGGGAGVAVAQGPLDLNAATAEQLDGLAGVGPATAQAIVEWRRQHGRFHRVSDLLEVRGIGPAKFAALRSQVKV